VNNGSYQFEKPQMFNRHLWPQPENHLIHKAHWYMVTIQHCISEAHRYVVTFQHCISEAHWYVVTFQHCISEAHWYMVTFQHCISQAPGLHLIWVTCYIHWDFCGYSEFFQRNIGIVPWNIWATPSNSLPPYCILIHCNLICGCTTFAVKTMPSVALKTEQSIHLRTALWN
jgi:hypothetical protein